MTPAALKPQVDLAIVEQTDVPVGTIRELSTVQGSDKLVASQGSTTAITSLNPMRPNGWLSVAVAAPVAAPRPQKTWI